MKISAVLLADHASIREGLLNVIGAGITRIARDPLPARLDVSLALMLQTDDLEDLLAPHTLEVTIRESAAGETGPVGAKAMMELQVGQTLQDPGPNLLVPVVVPIQSVPIPRTGVYRITVNLDGNEAGSYEFEVVKVGDLIPIPRWD